MMEGEILLDMDIAIGNGWGFSMFSNAEFLIFDWNMSVVATSRLETAEIARVGARVSLVGFEPRSCSG